MATLLLRAVLAGALVQLGSSMDRCLTGILSETGDACCARSCGKCGGSGCESRPGGAALCCGSSIAAECTSAHGMPPCRYRSGWRPPQARCSGGVLSESGDACCPSTCGKCGGAGCDARPGSAAQCCGSSIVAVCSASAGPPPCRYTQAAPAVQRKCTAGILSALGDACCTRGCGLCGGAGCDMRPGGALQCCGSSMASVCKTSDGPPPCKYLTASTSLQAVQHAQQAILEAERDVGQAAQGKCTGGILSQAGETCCPKECGRCGGAGCDARPGGAERCCGSSIEDVCSSAAGPAPCKYLASGMAPQPPQQKCAAGILSALGDACCPRECGRCGGAGCDTRPGGAARCCGGSISVLCSGPTALPPCLYADVRPAARHGEL
mmetsp:Transcript_96581/g.311901  ORF Transcript_96581/g.311901 Transcript_96581/m.311901 type:complete len:380 (-) Transcript_96581:35-1174(-)